jgi:hypothetical protein
MAANTVTVGLGDETQNSIATIVAAQALGYLKANTVLAQVVNRDYDDEVATHGQTLNIPIRGALAAYAKATDTVTTKQVPTDAKYTVALTNHWEVTFLIEDIAEAVTRPNLMNGYIEDGVKVLAEKIDSTLAALYSGLSQTITATSGLSEANFRNARRLLNAAKAPQGERWAVLHEDAEYEALGIERIVSREFGDEGSALREGSIGRFAGFNVVMSQNIAVATNVCKNLFFHRDAFVLVTRPLPLPPAGSGVLARTMGEDGVGIRVLMGYNINYLAYQVTIDALWGVAEMRDNHGVLVNTAEI